MQSSTTQFIKRKCQTNGVEYHLLSPISHALSLKQIRAPEDMCTDWQEFCKLSRQMVSRPLQWRRKCSVADHGHRRNISAGVTPGECEPWPWNGNSPSANNVQQSDLSLKRVYHNSQSWMVLDSKNPLNLLMRKLAQPKMTGRANCFHHNGGPRFSGILNPITSMFAPQSHLLRVESGRHGFRVCEVVLSQVT
jgi:hypothetical protein